MPFAADKEQFVEFGSVSMHILNAVFLAVDLLTNDIPIRFHFGGFSMIPAVCYLLFSWVFYAEGGEWRYFFMDPSKMDNVLWMALVCVMHFVSWTLIWNIGRWKEQWHRRRKRQLLLKEGLNGNAIVSAEQTDSF